jgi:sporulation protein YlmC with PRC-barrel domain
MPDPVAWNIVEPGWKVIDESGKELGRVAEVRGDPEADIFDGLNVKHGLLGGIEYIPAERVSQILEGEIHIGSGPEVV